jgi:hypothetical protein
MCLALPTVAAEDIRGRDASLLVAYVDAIAAIRIWERRLDHCEETLLQMREPGIL